MGISVFPAAGGGVTQKVLKYTTAGTDTTFTLPSGFGVGNPLMAEVTILGGGGSAGLGNYSSNSNVSFGGGGGAGGFFQEVIPLTENMTVRVGRGGPYNQNSGSSNPILGGNGGASYIGNGTIKNMFINPAFLGLYESEKAKVGAPFSGWRFGQGYGGFATGTQIIQIDSSPWQNAAFGVGQPYPIKPSTDYCFSIYGITDSGSYDARVAIDWVDADGTLISSINGTSTTLSANPSWTRMSVTGTAPSNAAYLRPKIVRVGGTVTTYASCPMLEEGVTTPSTYVDGATTGYKWVGTPLGSPTILASDTMYIVNGGGGGGALSTQTGAGVFHSGFAGACSGGGAIRLSSDWTGVSQAALFSGCGGGLGGNAISPNISLTSSNDTFSFGTQLLETPGRYNVFADFSHGTYACGSSASGNQTMSTNGAAPGSVNIFGYGKGGSGTQFMNHSNNGLNDFQYQNNSGIIAESYKRARPNSGDGGNATTVGIGTSSKRNLASPGGSGLVIIKYWS